MRKAVLDMGTNTFHLMVVEWDEAGSWRPLHRNRVFVKLAEAGLHHIGDAAFERGLQAMHAFRADLDAWSLDPGEVTAFGTAALRSAANAPEFIQKVYDQTGMRAQVISGEEEARLIYLGVRQATPWPARARVLIMDIGGGSVEFILADRQEIFWKRSFNVGVAVLHRLFHRNDPISAVEIADIEHFLETELTPLWEVLHVQPATCLVGAAGAFDTIDLFAIDPATKPPLYGYLPAPAFDPVYQLFIQSTRTERLDMPLLAPERQEMIVAAVVLIRYVLQRAGIQEIYTSTYSMKEGMVADSQVGG
jgi:exopolyphosphatase/guanosine-5'-triphosphate,3'-diphosphate pyrophosphatase